MHLRDIARREETRRADSVRDVAMQSRPIRGGGIACRDAPGSWMNYIVGAGLDGPVPRAEIEQLIEWYTRPDDHFPGGISPRLETTPYADAGLLRDAQDLGFRLRDFTNVFVREISAERPIPAPRLDGIEIRVIDPADADALEESARVSVSGFFPPGTPLLPVALALARRSLGHPRTIAVAAYADGRVVGAGGIDAGCEVASLMGLSVLPEYRRRGIQLAASIARINAAAARGVRLVTVGSTPAGPTERNALRMGFAMAYTKLILVRSPDPQRAAQ